MELVVNERLLSRQATDDDPDDSALTSRKQCVL